MKNEYRIEGETAVIVLPRKDGSYYETVIDKDDLPKLEGFCCRWWATIKRNGKYHYVQNRKLMSDGTFKSVMLTRVIMDAPKGYEVDHIDGNTLNNRKSNLRVITPAQNQQNRRGCQTNSKSGLRGVRELSVGKWEAKYKIGGVGFVVGIYDSKDRANEEVKKARAKYMPYSQEALSS